MDSFKENVPQNKAVHFSLIVLMCFGYSGEILYGIPMQR